MPDFTPDETRRWDAWQRANVLSARRTDRIMRYVGLAGLTALVIALLIAALR